MVRTSRRNRPEPTESEIELLEALHTIANHPKFELAKTAILELREAYFKNLAQGLALQAGPVDQREIDYKRGFWKGVLWALNGLPRTRARDFEKFLEAALKEAEQVGA